MSNEPKGRQEEIEPWPEPVDGNLLLCELEESLPIGGAPLPTSILQLKQSATFSGYPGHTEKVLPLSAQRHCPNAGPLLAELRASVDEEKAVLRFRTSASHVSSSRVSFRYPQIHSDETMDETAETPIRTKKPPRRRTQLSLVALQSDESRSASREKRPHGQC